MIARIASLPLLAVASLSSAAAAQEIDLRPLVGARLRWEDVDQTGLPRDADAVTMRIRSGIEARRGAWSALAETEATLAITERYNSGTNGRTGYPLVVDPQNIELNRAHPLSRRERPRRDRRPSADRTGRPAFRRTFKLATESADL